MQLVLPRESDTVTENESLDVVNNASTGIMWAQMRTLQRCWVASLQTMFVYAWLCIFFQHTPFTHALTMVAWLPALYLLCSSISLQVLIILKAILLEERLKKSGLMKPNLQRFQHDLHWGWRVMRCIVISLLFQLITCVIEVIWWWYYYSWSDLTEHELWEPHICWQHYHTTGVQ